MARMSRENAANEDKIDESKAIMNMEIRLGERAYVKLRLPHRQKRHRR